MTLAYFACGKWCFLVNTRGCFLRISRRYLAEINMLTLNHPPNYHYVYQKCEQILCKCINCNETFVNKQILRLYYLLARWCIPDDVDILIFRWRKLSCNINGIHTYISNQSIAWIGLERLYIFYLITSRLKFRNEFIEFAI